MPVDLDVPFITQLDIGGHVKPTYAQAVKGEKPKTIDDPTGCWYASACMVAYYFEKGPRLGVPELYARALDAGGQLGHYATGSGPANHLCANHHELLAKREGLSPVPGCETEKAFTIDDIESLLNGKGPIFMYWMKTHGAATYGHASVIKGTDAAGIIYHDPEKAPNSKMSIADFGTKRQKWKYALMQRG